MQKADFGRGVKVRTHNEAFGPKTKVPEKGYDIITMFHVHYYWISAKERSAIMDKLFKLLIPGGKLFILMLDKVCTPYLIEESSLKKYFVKSIYSVLQYTCSFHEIFSIVIQYIHTLYCDFFALLLGL